MNRVGGKVCVVTGGTQGLGAAIARRLAEAGAAGIVACGRNEAKGREVASAIERDTGATVHFVRCDLESVDDCRAVITAADDRFGQVDVLVNAAGLTDRGTILDTTPDLFDRMFAVNVRAPFFLMQDAIRLMIRDGIAGSIVNIGSTSEHAGQPFIAPYCASKGALATLTRNTAFAAMRNRIRVNQLDIGWMASDNEGRVQREQMGGGEHWLKQVSGSMPFGRLVDPAEVARAVAFLASDDAGLMTGAVIHFDQSVWGGYASSPPVPEAPLALPG